MKSVTKKLSLSKSTLANLEKQQLSGILGGMTYTCSNYCVSTNNTPCSKICYCG